jgi:hypothetical protein
MVKMIQHCSLSAGLAHSLTGLSARRQAVVLESHFNHHANALISALHKTASLMMYVTQLPMLQPIKST